MMTSTSTTIELGQLLSPQLLARLREEAEYQQSALGDLVRKAIEDYIAALDDDAEIEDTPDEEILASFKQAWHEAMTGQTRPVREMLEEIRRELGEEPHDDES